MTLDDAARPRVTLVGLGPGDLDLTTPAAQDAIGSADRVVLRTRRHPAAAHLTGAISCDDLYESAEDLDEVYAAIADRIGELAREHGHVVYAVPGSVSVAETAVALIRDRSDLDCKVIDGLSFVELAWSRLGVDPFIDGVRLIDGHRFVEQAAGVSGPMLVGQCDSVEVLSDIKLTDTGLGDAAIPDVVVLQRLGLPDEQVTAVPWDELDRTVMPDHLTSVFIPRRGPDLGAALVGFDDTVRRVRRDCPWDRQQTHRTLIRYLIEETYELVDAIDRYEPESGDGADELVEELGDVAFQVVLHAVLGAERGWFDLAEVLVGVDAKLVSRHPHVFAPSGDDPPDRATLEANWSALKAAEKPGRSAADGVARSLPSPALVAAVLSAARKAGVVVSSPSGPAGEMWDAVSRVVAAGDDPEAVLRAAALHVLDSLDGGL